VSVVIWDHIVIIIIIIIIIIIGQYSTYLPWGISLVDLGYILRWFTHPSTNPAVKGQELN